MSLPGFAHNYYRNLQKLINYSAGSLEDRPHRPGCWSTEIAQFLYGGWLGLWNVYTQDKTRGLEAANSGNLVR